MTVQQKRFLILNALNVYDVIITLLIFAIIPSWQGIEGNPIMRGMPVDVAVLIKLGSLGIVAFIASFDHLWFRVLAAFMTAIVTWNLLMWLPWIVDQAGMPNWAVFIISIPPWAWIPAG